MECRPSKASSIPAEATNEKSPSDPLQLILKRLDDMQGQITTLCNKACNILASQTSVNSEEGEVSDRENEHTLPDMICSRKCNKSPFDEDPSYRHTLAPFRTLLGLTIPEDFLDQASQIFESKLKAKNRRS